MFERSEIEFRSDDRLYWLRGKMWVRFVGWYPEYRYRIAVVAYGVAQVEALQISELRRFERRVA